MALVHVSADSECSTDNANKITGNDLKMQDISSEYEKSVTSVIREVENPHSECRVHCMQNLHSSVNKLLCCLIRH